MCAKRKLFVVDYALVYYTVFSKDVLTIFYNFH